MLFESFRTLLSPYHVEIAKGTPEQNQTYCSKADTRISGPWERGIIPKQGKRTDIELFTHDILAGVGDVELAERHGACFYRYSKAIDRLRVQRYKRVQAEDLARRLVAKSMSIPVTVLWGDTSTGKTLHVYSHEDPEDVYPLQFGDGSPSSLWFDDYCGERVLLLDDFYGNIKLDLLLRILRPYRNRLQIKGYYTYPCFTRIYITSNCHPDEWYKTIQDAHPRAYRALKARLTNVIHVTAD